MLTYLAACLALAALSEWVTRWREPEPPPMPVCAYCQMRPVEMEG